MSPHYKCNMSFMPTWGHGMNCFLCGMMIQAGDRRFKGLAIPERKDWAEKELKGDHLVPAPEVEETAFGKLSTQWGHFFRAIVEGPPDSTLALTGIGFRENDSKAVVPASPGKACIVAPSCASHGKRQCKVFRARGWRIFPLDVNYSNMRFGYPVHAHCWMLVGHVIGLEVVENNLRVFCETMYEYWSKHAQHWQANPSHPTDPACRYIWRQPGVRQLEAKARCPWSAKSHASDSPLHLPKVQKMIRQVASRSEKASRVGYPARSPVHLPLEIRIMIIDELYMLPNFSRNDVRGVRRAPRALGWKLPDRYWISRCSMDLGLDVVGIPNIDKVADWGKFCTTLGYNLAGSKWWCVSGLALRESILDRLRTVQERFLKRVNSEADVVE